MKRVFLFASFILLFAFSLNAQVVKNYTLQNLDNQRVNLHDLKGEKITVIDFWTTWCRPCRKAIPELNKIYKAYKGQGVQVIGINCDGPRTVAKVPGVSRTLEIEYPVLIDINSDVINSLNPGNFPTLIILDRDNKIQYFHEGFVPGEEEEFIAAIEKLLKK